MSADAIREQMEAYRAAARRVRQLADAEPDGTAYLYLDRAARDLSRHANDWRKKVDDAGVAEYQSGQAGQFT